jgi:hypothetical protein
MEDQENAESRIERIDLEEGSEWRFELEGDEDIAVRVSAACLRSSYLLRVPETKLSSSAMDWSSAWSVSD